jgi:putative N6-adenine-specific DNA methylase
MELFITCSQGMETLLAEELEELGFPKTALGYRGVYVPEGNIDAVYRINYCSRIAGRVLFPLSHFKCWDRQALYKGIYAINWRHFFSVGQTFAIDANVSNSREFRNSHYVAQLAKDAICDQFREKTGSRPNIDRANPDVQLNVFIHETTCIVSFDTSGAPLSRRGYRQAEGEAPLRQSLAAALLRLANYKGDEIMCDPCCGSGTLLIEAALIASRTPPGFLRQKWGFVHLPEFSQVEWLKVKNEADAQKIPLKPNKFFGVDINKNALHAAKVNLRAAGLHQFVDVSLGDFRDWTPDPRPDFLMTNPPHGLRLDDVDFLRSLYRELGDFMKLKMTKPARGFIFTGNLELAKEVGLAAKRRFEVDNSGIDSRLLEFDLF